MADDFGGLVLPAGSFGDGCGDGAHKKRQLSEAYRARLIEAGKVGREALPKWQKERVQAQNLAPNETILTLVGSWQGEASMGAGRRVKIEAQ
jgi:hypothetical protein